MKRILCMLLSLTMLASVVSCSEDKDEAEAVDNSQTAENVSENTEDETEEQDPRLYVKGSLPEDLDFGGQTMRVYSRGGDEETKIEFFAEQTGEIVSDAAYQRNLNTEERLNVKINVTLNEASTRHYNDADVIRTAVKAGSDEYDVYSNCMYGTMPLVLEKMFYNMNKLKYIDFSQQWWNQSYVELAGIDGKLYAAAGDLSLSMLSGSFCVFFNRDVFSQYYPNGNLYDDVNNGIWTMDKLAEYSRGIYTDLNGDGIQDQDDFYGLYVRNDQTLAADAFIGGAHLTFVENDGNGGYSLAVANERTVEFVEKIRTLVYTDNISARGTYNDDTVMQTMLNSTTIFTPWMLGGISLLRDMKDNYGILPMPKLNEEQSDYSTYSHDGFSVFVIPVTCQTPDNSAAFLEAMCMESYRLVMPAYFEVALKVKYARDDVTAQMLDLISDSVYLDISYLYNQSLSTVVTSLRTLFIDESKCDTIMSSLAKNNKVINRQLNKIIKSYSDMD